MAADLGALLRDLRESTGVVERGRAARRLNEALRSMSSDDVRTLAREASARVAPELLGRIEAGRGVELTPAQRDATVELLGRIRGDQADELIAIVGAAVGDALAEADAIEDEGATDDATAEDEATYEDEAADEATAQDEGTYEATYEPAVAGADAGVAEGEQEWVADRHLHEWVTDEGEEWVEADAEEPAWTEDDDHGESELEEPEGEAEVTRSEDDGSPSIEALTVAGRIHAAASGARVRQLARLFARTPTPPSAADRQLILEAVPDGWIRRRTVLDLLEAGAYWSQAEARVAVGAMGRPTDRAWVAASMVEAGVVELDEVADLLTPAAADRLRARYR